MVIGNGFFANTRQDFVDEASRRSGCDVALCPFPTIGNIEYYISKAGDLYGVQKIQGKFLGRLKKAMKHKCGFTARLQQSPQKEVYYRLELLVYCTFTLGYWSPTANISFKNGNRYDCRIENLEIQKQKYNPELSDAMEEKKDIYDKEFYRISKVVAYHTGIAIEDSEDVVQDVFMTLCAKSNNCRSLSANDFIGLWIKLSRFRAVDFYRRYGKRFDSELYEVLLERNGTQDALYEHDLFHIQRGEKRAAYLRMWAEGYTPTEIAKECGVSRANVSSSICRSLQFLQRYLQKELRL